MPSPVTTTNRATRVAVTAMFLANGVTVASFLVRIPSVRDQLGLREAALGLVLSSLAVGVVSGLVLAGRIVGRFGSRSLTLGGASAVAVVLPIVGAAPNVWVLVLALAATGTASSVMDVGMNAQGIGVERSLGRSVMLGFHGAWSVGTLLAAVVGSVVMEAGIPVGWHLLGVAVVVLALLAVAQRHLRIEDRSAEAARRSPRFAIPRGPLLPLALIVLAGAIGEATAGDWSGIHLADNLDATAGRVAWGLVAYTAAMTLVRLFGDLLVRRIGREAMVIAGGVLAGIGFVTVALTPVLLIAVTGFALVGIGVGVTVPLAFAASGAVAETPGSGVAAVAAMGYLAFVIGPSAIGVAADLAGLPAVFIAVGALIVALVARPQRVLRETD